MWHVSYCGLISVATSRMWFRFSSAPSGIPAEGEDPNLGYALPVATGMMEENWQQCEMHLQVLKWVYCSLGLRTFCWSVLGMWPVIRPLLQRATIGHSQRCWEQIILKQ